MLHIQSQDATDAIMFNVKYKKPNKTKVKQLSLHKKSLYITLKISTAVSSVYIIDSL